MADTATTRDAFYAGRLLLTQPQGGHRSGTDAVLLATAAPRDFEGLAIDAGSGVGAAGLGVAILCPRAEILLLERDPVVAQLGAENIVANGFATRASMVRCDLLDRIQRRALRPADLVLTNPPFYEAHAVRASSCPSRGAAHVLAPGTTLADWIAACVDLLAPKGTFIMIHKASALPAALAAMGARLGGLSVLPIQSHADSPAKRVMIRGSAGSRAPFALHPPLVLHDEGGFTPHVDRLHQGLDHLHW